jgi:4-diphosphocytidyl-2-C-methyl-D-erythritol kinase
MASIIAKAKINLFFHITGKRPDGYHLIESLMVFANDVYDAIEINQAEINSTSVQDGEFAHLLKDETNNLIDKAIEYFAGTKKYSCKLTKNIPIGAGLGGGSSDAAIVAKYITNKEMDDEINQKLTKIGADLPICYHAKPAFCSGIGEIIEPIKNFPTAYLVLVNPNKALLTKDVFKYNKHLNTDIILDKPIDLQKNINKLIEFLKPLKNDLTEAASNLMPDIKIILDLLDQQKGCSISRMSGSGSTCFGIFTDEQEAIKATKNIMELHPQYWIKHTEI